MIVLRRLYSRRPNSVKVLQKTKNDPGIFQQKKVLEHSPDETENTDFDELESDFMNVHKSHREHVEKMEMWREKEKYLIVKQKYFKQKFPNFLTWHDKEQVRYLHNSDPEEWSIERLSEGFPALTEVIEKIIKGKWTKLNQNKISNHDKTVLRNWNDFKQGKLNNLPQELKEHLQKFSHRTLNFEPFQESHGKELITQNENRKPTNGEFSEILASHHRLKDQNPRKQEFNKEYLEDLSFNSNKHTNEKTNRFTVKKDNMLMTFRELQDKVERKISKGQEISFQDKLLKEASFPQKEDMSTIELGVEDISSIVEKRHKTDSDKVGFVRKTTRDMSHLIYPEKITIPTDIYRKGYTYKLNDCYYDSDGEFLYRVPGMG